MNVHSLCTPTHCVSNLFHSCLDIKDCDKDVCSCLCVLADAHDGKHSFNMINDVMLTIVTILSN